MQLPVNLRVRALNEKYVLKKAFEDKLPREITRRKKRPFTTFYVSSLFREHRPEYFDEVLSEAAVKKAGLFNYQEVSRMKNDLRKP